ncbi:MAG: hypothetical protein ACRBN8_39660 [Nannocystales bacterium]
MKSVRIPSGQPSHRSYRGTSTTVLSLALVSGALVSGVLGCAAPEEESFGVQSSSESSSTPPPEPLDPCDAEGRSCDCGEFGASAGTSVCEDGKLTCDCSACPDLETPADFTACSGDVLGTWRFVGTRTSPALISYQTSLGQSGQCPSTTSHGGRRDLRFDFRAGGEATMVASESFSETTTIPGDCMPTRCENVTYFPAESPFAYSSDTTSEGGSCRESDCDSCRCSTVVANQETGPVEWDYSGSLLHIGSGAVGQFQYCVDGNELTLKKDNTVYDFEAVDVAGAPLACAERSSGQCPLGEGCTTGGCVGVSAECVDADEASCSSLVGCEWEPSMCVGEVPLDCALADADVVPGCYFEVL